MMSTSNRMNMLSSWPSSLQFVKDFDRTNCSIKSEESTSTDELDDDQNNDGEGVWSPDIEQSFHEALTIYPPCGRRKIILSDEGKMFGRNELISRYIKMRTGKLRTRKQVSSHIQVLAKRKSKELQTFFKDPNFKEPHRPLVYNQHYHQLHNPTTSPTIIGDNTSTYYAHQHTPVSFFSSTPTLSFKPTAPILWQQPSMDMKTFSSTTTDFVSAVNVMTSSITSNRLKLLEFAGYIQSKSDANLRHYLMRVSEEAGTDMKSERIKVDQIIDLFPMLKELYTKGPRDAFYIVKVWVNVDYEENSTDTYHHCTIFESFEDNMNVCITTKACSFGKTIVEKIENGTTAYNDLINKYIHRSTDTIMCNFMIDFIKKLKIGLHKREMMNTVLEHLRVLQTVVSKDTDELLLCIAYIFELSESSNGTQSIAYRLCE
ncbi:unnamed protein product [Rotaria magnacalcarata]|uniref:TEA domain-containing protein n=1 Tax=Rotaria magnacalcarata TaxID=392030 RepID=A0A815C0A7_9BILA|nr:unnamed protein product [Rotaria magnacalcarata]CAF1274122.1 unnamed protein product [Rotaria magnacalcarata]CAF2048468.1 unnamed protein product [Rotaria magnacalcarata]CAF2140390.1 unnamed protein product [Rotaria magnacalcarata]